MPLFLKSIDPSLDIFGNRELFNFNKDPANGENESALTLINWFSPIPNISANNTFEFLTPSLKGFRFNHSLSDSGIFGNFAFEKYDRFGLATPLWKYDEITDSSIFFKSFSLNSNKITNLANGIADADAINLGQVNSSITALGFSALSTNGLLVRTAANTYVSRTLTAGSGISISNGSGVSGHPTIAASNIPISALSGYPSDPNVFLNGSGGWSTPSFPNPITTTASSYHFAINNTNSVATATDLLIQNNGTDGVAVGFNNSTNEAYLWSFGTALLKFGTANTTRARILNSGTFDLLTNDLTTSGNINATTGTLKGNNLAAHNSGSLAVLNSLAMNSKYITSLANPINNQDAATKLYVDNNSGGSGTKSILHGYNAATYSTNVGVGDHLKFDSTVFTRGSSISLDTTTTYNTSTNTASVGRITLAAGKTYKLTGSINNVVSASYNATRWHNSDTNAALGLVSGSPSPISTTDRAPGGVTVSYINPSISTRVELRIAFNGFSSVNGTADAIGPAWFTVEEV